MDLDVRMKALLVGATFLIVSYRATLFLTPTHSLFNNIFQFFVCVSAFWAENFKFPDFKSTPSPSPPP